MGKVLNLNSVLNLKSVPKSVLSISKRFSTGCFDFDVLVVGGGHAGTEAANAACNLKARTALVTQRLETIGEMSCNPSFGGVGKGHLLREIDALDGLCPRICDQAGIHYKILNRKKGPAVQGLRAQIDRVLYKKYLQEELFGKPIHFEESSVENLLIESRDGQLYCDGVILANGKRIRSKTTIITTGTFLNGLILIGKEKFSAGRMGDKASIGLSDTFKRLNFKMGRLKTGTPPRIFKNTIDFDEVQCIRPDANPEPFSYMNDRVRIESSDQLPTYIVYTDDKVADLVKSNIESSSYIREEARGVRYCPSLEAKVLKFNSSFHQVWLEDESLDSDLIYPNGLTTGFPFDHQQKIVNSIRGLTRAKLARPGYSIEYDFIDPTQLFPTLETKLLNNLYLAGQINGTTGYEEAGAQGVLAGLNAAGKCQEKPHFLISRTEAFIGVIVDDLTRTGVTEPYRMMTARSEYRLSLRPDNADQRLTERGYEYGCVSEKRFSRYTEAVEQMKLIESELGKMNYKCSEWKELFESIGVEFNPTNLTRRRSGLQLLEYYGVNVCDLKRILEKQGQADRLSEVSDRVLERVGIDYRYRTLTIRQNSSIEEFKKEEMLELSKDLDYSHPSLCLNKESIELLTKHRPLNIAAAARLPGIPQQTIFKLIIHARNAAKAAKAAKAPKVAEENSAATNEEPTESDSKEPNEMKEQKSCNN